MAAIPKEAGTVPVRVQVIDLEPRLVDVVVPTYLEARDLTQRIARDAGLGAWWPDGSRRAFHLWVRGRVLADHERLQDVGVVPLELVHLLPAPPPDEGVRERPSGVPATRALPVARGLRVMRWAMAVGWATLWMLAASAAPGPVVGFLCSLCLVFLASYALRRHGEPVWALPYVVTSMALAVALSLPAVVAGVRASPSSFEAMRFVVLTTAGGAVGLLASLLAWMGPAEPASDARVAASAEAAGDALARCGICGRETEMSVSELCPYGCGKVFHRGCLRARQSVSSASGCEVCGAAVARG